MSYTKLSKEVTKWLKDYNLPCYGKADDSPEVTKKRIDIWMIGVKHMLQHWLEEKRYSELISCAHGGWYQDNIIFEPVAKHFVQHKLFDELRFLCERGIRFSVEDMIYSLKSETEEKKPIDIEAINNIDVKAYIEGTAYSEVGEIAKYRKRALEQIGRYLNYLEQIQAPESYVEIIKKIQNDVYDMTVKKSDLKQIKFRLPKD